MSIKIVGYLVIALLIVSVATMVIVAFSKNELAEETGADGVKKTVIKKSVFGIGSGKKS